MLNFQDYKAMLPSEMAAYIEILETEVKNQQEYIDGLSKADLFICENGEFTTEKELLQNLEIGDVVEARSVKHISSGFLVKLSKTRIDSYDDRIKAEGAAILHSV